MWIMGADNLAQFHRWRAWREIADMVPILVVDRPGASFAALSSRGGAGSGALAPAGKRGGAARLSQTSGLDLPPRAEVEPVLDGAQARKG